VLLTLAGPFVTSPLRYELRYQITLSNYVIDTLRYGAPTGLSVLKWSASTIEIELRNRDLFRFGHQMPPQTVAEKVQLSRKYYQYQRTVIFPLSRIGRLIQKE
jgi:hypothetical protein